MPLLTSNLLLEEDSTWCQYILDIGQRVHIQKKGTLQRCTVYFGTENKKTARKITTVHELEDLLSKIS